MVYIPAEETSDGIVKVIYTSIEDTKLIQVILKHLGLWNTNNHGPPNRNFSNTANELTVDESYSQTPPIDHWLD